MKSVFIILLSFLISFSSFSQKWEVGGFLGASAYEGDVHCRTFDGASLTDYAKFAYGIQAKYLLNDVLAFRLSLLQSKLEGNEALLDNAGRQARGFGFKSNITEAALMMEWDILGYKRNKGGSLHRILSPYIFGGIGAAFTDPDIDFKSLNTVGVLKDRKEIKTTHLAIPVGLGIKYDITDRFNLGIEAGLRLPMSDYIDGISYAANPDANDYYAFAGIIGNVKLGDPDMDNDGVADKMDRCPEVAGLVELKGCPDLDGDGISDINDDCPNIFGPKETDGCPDADEDGVMDERDDCPDVPGLAKLRGCPDRDNDGVKDSNDDCPDVKGVRALMGCPDTDGDGVSDALDLCPDVAGLKDRSGCPDSDGDGVLDKDDDCPNKKGEESSNGCPPAPIVTTTTIPESATTGMTYYSSSAYNKGDYTTKVGSGNYNSTSSNPIIYYSSEAYQNGVGYENSSISSNQIYQSNESSTTFENSSNISSILKSAQDNVLFHSGTSKLKSSSNTSLKKILKIMKDNPETTLNISGYTDDLGDDDENECLSRMRAKSCYKYLKNHGISEERLNYEGYGETNPIGDNATPQGRKKNRRVEFSLY